MREASSNEGYSPLSITLHWLGAAFVIAPFVTHEAARGSFGYTVHIGGGAIIGILLLWRVAHRATRDMPERPPQPILLICCLRPCSGIFFCRSPRSSSRVTSCHGHSATQSTFLDLFLSPHLLAPTGRLCQIKSLNDCYLL